MLFDLLAIAGFLAMGAAAIACCVLAAREVLSENQNQPRRNRHDRSRIIRDL